MASEEKPNTRRNFISIAASIILMRCGWIFKTESVVMPVIIDALGGSAATRGWLMVFNRLGQSVPQFLFAHKIAGLSRLKPWFIFISLSQLLPWASLAILFPAKQSQTKSFLLVFFVCYVSHWLLLGTARIFEGSCQGKLIRPDLRGRLMSAASFIGGVSSVCLAAWLMADWMGRGRFDLIFWTVFGFFGLSALSLFGLKEEQEDSEEGKPVHFKDTISIFLKDAEFRKLLAAAVLMSFIFMLFPHFVIYGKERLGFQKTGYANLVIIQNLSMAAIAVVIGLIADKKGNRLAFRLAALGPVSAPCVAVILGYQGETGRLMFPCVFALIGACPVMQRVLVNYALEMSPNESQPQYLATLQLIVILPMILSPLAGMAIGHFGFEPVFIFCDLCIALGWLITFRIREPRKL
ncbi:MAG: hypothetical protein O3B01_23030 [Planctomycetota bacterium]|nr:hypothetical protein [Planctomycetota bacterium]MDA1141446.1 hypothetical protein [Planctomycetota bacterium]